jgi:hypothetical protein
MGASAGSIERAVSEVYSFVDWLAPLHLRGFLHWYRWIGFSASGHHKRFSTGDNWSKHSNLLYAGLTE